MSTTVGSTTQCGIAATGLIDGLRGAVLRAGMLLEFVCPTHMREGTVVVAVDQLAPHAVRSRIVVHMVALPLAAWVAGQAGSFHKRSAIGAVVYASSRGTLNPRA